MDFIELTCNAPVVFEEVNFVGWRELDPEEPYRSLARKLLTVGFLDPELRAAEIRNYGREARITGFLLYNHMFGRCSMADSCFAKRLRGELQTVGVPLLTLDGDCLDETIDPCSTDTKVRAFIEALNRKKFGNLFGDCRGRSRHFIAAQLARSGLSGAWRRPVHTRSSLAHCCSNRFGETGIAVPSFWAKSETRYSSSIQRRRSNSGSKSD